MKLHILSDKSIVLVTNLSGHNTTIRKLRVNKGVLIIPSHSFLK